MIGVTSPTMLIKENGMGSGVIVSRRRKRNGLCPIVSRIVVVENHARSFATTVPTPVHGDPRRDPVALLLSGKAGLIEIAVVDLVEARRGEMDADELDFRRQTACDVGAQIALAIDAVALAA